MKTVCHICAADSPVLFPEYAEFKRITSDCKPWPSGGGLALCRQCSCVQAVVNDPWRSEIQKIYQSYTIYFQGHGTEQNVFDQKTGAASSRSDKLLEKLQKNIPLPDRGRLLDIGCGNGSFLGSFGRLFPKWSLAGSEYDDKHRAHVESLPGVEQFFTSDISQIPGTFDLISLVHVLEHIESPRGFLNSIREKLNPGGFLLIELPYYVENPFELFIADHATHFDGATISRLLTSCGFQVWHRGSEWIPKELTLVAATTAPKNSPPPPAAPPDMPELLQWLKSVITHADTIAKKSTQFGLFGTSIAAGWLFSQIEGQVKFFVDEDPNRAGGQHFNLPVYHPSDIPAGSDVYVVLPPVISRQVTQRLQSGTVRFHEVPAWH